MQLHEKYRPTTFNSIVGQDKAVKVIERLTANCWGGRAYWITGNSGTGKTTLAKIMADIGADPMAVTETTGRELIPTKLAEIKRQWMYVPMSKFGYCLIVNESHGLSKPVIELFLDLLESLKDNVLIIFTTTRDGNDLFEEQMDSSPFQSRCTTVNLTSQGLNKPMAERLKWIAQQENLDGRPINAYERLLFNHHNNFRAAIQEVEAGRMLN
jgi:replication-associated recombination protein RarA